MHCESLRNKIGVASSPKRFKFFINNKQVNVKFSEYFCINPIQDWRYIFILIKFCIVIFNNIDII